jgi:hypothetical protein
MSKYEFGVEIPGILYLYIGWASPAKWANINMRHKQPPVYV